MEDNLKKIRMMGEDTGSCDAVYVFVGYIHARVMDGRFRAGRTNFGGRYCVFWFVGGTCCVSDCTMRLHKRA